MQIPKKFVKLAQGTRFKIFINTVYNVCEMYGTPIVMGTYNNTCIFLDHLNIMNLSRFKNAPKGIGVPIPQKISV